MGCVAGTVTPGIWGRQHGGVRARGEFRQSKRNFLSYMMRVPVAWTKWEVLGLLSGKRVKINIGKLTTGQMFLLLRSKRGSHWQITFCIMVRCTIVRMAYYHLVLGGSLVGKRGVLQRFVHSGMGWGLPLQRGLGNQSKITKKCRLWRQAALGSKSNVGLWIKNLR